MTQREAAIQQLKALKGKPLKAKAEHILTYYRLPIIVLAASIMIVVSLVHHLATAKESVLNVTCLNASVTGTEKDSFVQGFAEIAEIDTEKYTVSIAADQADADREMGIYDGEVLAAQIIAGMIDVLATDEETASQWLYQDVFSDLSELLTPEQYARYAGSLLYVDAAILRRIEERNESLDSIVYPDPTKPEEMDAPVPVMIRLSADSVFSSLYFAGEENVFLGIVGNAPDTEYAVMFIEYAMDQISGE